MTIGTHSCNYPISQCSDQVLDWGRNESDHSTVVDATWGGLGFLETVDPLVVSHTTVFRVHSEWVKKYKTSIQQQFCHQVRMVCLVLWEASNNSNNSLES